MNLNNIYKQLTNIDIDEQKILWDERGKGYYGEFLVFEKLYTNLTGVCKILMNLNIPTENNNTTEIDLILIHETGIYVFEIKHYKGTIYGNYNDKIWTQYFRTVKNSTFKNPILQNEYHINALKKMYKDIPIKSVIVFTNSNCNIKVRNTITNTNIILCTIHDLINKLKDNFKDDKFNLSLEQTDEIFNNLSKYSQMQEEILYDGKEASFASWLHPTLKKLEEEKNTLTNQIQQNEKKSKKIRIIETIIIISCLLFSIFSICIIKSNFNSKFQQEKQTFEDKLKVIEQNYNNELEKFKQNFKHVDEIDDEYFGLLNKYFSVSNISINNLSSNTITFTAKISRANDTYGMALNENSKYIVMTSNGKVYEYDVFGNHLNYNRYSNLIGKGIRDSGNLYPVKITGITKDEINYIKITNIDLFKLDTTRTIIKQNLELELFSK